MPSLFQSWNDKFPELIETITLSHNVRNGTLYHKVMKPYQLIRVGNDVITSVDAVCDLGVTLDSKLTMQWHVNKVASACFYHIRRLKQI